MHRHFERLKELAESPQRAKALHEALVQSHLSNSSSLIKGRNVLAGYTRGWGLQFNILRSFIKQDSLFQESFALAKDHCLTHEVSLMNIFLIMKYGLPGGSGDIVEFGSYRGGSAIFMANVAKKLGLKTTIYALDTFQGIPTVHPSLDFLTTKNFQDTSLKSLSRLITQLNLSNLIPIQGPFEESVNDLLHHSQKILLSYIDCKNYASTRFAISKILPRLHEKGGYLLLHDPIHGDGLGPLQAMEEMIDSYELYAEQAYPHMVYRYPKLQNE